MIPAVQERNTAVVGAHTDIDEEDVVGVVVVQRVGKSRTLICEYY
jgi:hypothetical protein